MGIISFRVYFIVAISVFAILFAIQLMGGGDSTASFFQQVLNSASRTGLGFTVANFIVGPFIWTFKTYVYGPAVAALLWPVAILWLLLFVVVWIYTLIAPGFNDIPKGN